jgi:Tfp pilus assembly protein PilV
LRSRLRALRAAEGGFALIEVLVSAGLVMVIAAGVLGGVDAPGLLSGRDQSSSQAASLAQKDQELLRSTPIATLINGPLNVTRPPATIDQKTYTVTSKVTWVTDSGSSLSCATSDTTTGDYLKLQSTVTESSLKKPVVIESLLAPPNGSLASKKGNLGVLVTDEQGQPEAGVPVTLTPGGTTISSDANGCVFFGLLTPGQYTVKLSKAGWVDKDGNAAPTQTATVSSGNTALVQQQYAQAITVTTNVWTPAYGTDKLSAARAITVANAGMTAGSKLVNAANQTVTQVVAGQLFPFTDGYSVWTGACANSNPVPGAGPFVTNPIPGPGGASTITARQPALNLTVTLNGQPPGSSVQAYADLTSSAGSGCSYSFKNIPLTSAGKFTDPGFPEGTYDICIDAPSYATYHVARTGVAVTNFATGTPLTIEGTSGPVPGLCP